MFEDDEPLDFDPDDYTADQLRWAIEHCDNPATLNVLSAMLRHARTTETDTYFPEARSKQIPPDGDWSTWLILAGRGFGKTRTGSEWIADLALETEGAYAVAAPTFAAARDVCVEGRGTDATRPSGILTVLQRRGREEGRDYKWNRSLGELLIFDTNAQIKLLSADEPDRARGWNFAAAWCDELSSWRYRDAFDQLRLTLRAGDRPRMLITTTPKPTALIKEMAKRGDVVMTRGTTWENSDNLPRTAIEDFERMYAGTRLGRQELEGEILDDLGLLFSRGWFRLEDARQPWPMRVRYWDLASTQPGYDNPDPDWTVGTLMAHDPTRRAFEQDNAPTVFGGQWQVQHVVRIRETPGEVERLILQTAREDGAGVVQVIEQDPGQAGVSQVEHYKKVLAGFPYRSWRPSGSKVVRAELCSAAVQQGRVSVAHGPWVTTWFDELEVFPSNDAHDDQVDSLSGAFAVLDTGGGGVAESILPHRNLRVSTSTRPTRTFLT